MAKRADLLNLLLNQENPETGNATGRQPDLLNPGSSKFSARYWLTRIYRPRYSRNGESKEVPELYARIFYSGRREAVGLSTNNREEAARRAAKLYLLVRTAGWTAALDEFKPDRSTPRSMVTVGDYIATVKPLVRVRERSFNNYCYAFRRIALEAAGFRDRTKARFSSKTLAWRARADAVLLAKVTREAIETWMKNFITDAGKNPLAIQRARRSVNSFLGNAASLFSRHILREMAKRGITPPSPLPFHGIEKEREGSKRYVSTINAAELLRAARTELADADPDSYAVVLLGLGAGLRRSEIDSLCWTQIDFAKSVIRVVNSEIFEAKSDESANEVFVDAGLLAALRPGKDAAEGLFVVLPGTPHNPQASGQYYRCQKVFARTTAWLREHGVMGLKPIHDLRKEFGSMICAQADIYTASQQLRHSEISTTAEHYLDRRRRSTVGIAELLAEKEGAK